MTLLCKIKYYHIVKQILIDLANVAACHPNHPLKLKIWFFAVHNDMAKLRFWKLFTERSFTRKKLKDLWLPSRIVYKKTDECTSSDNEWYNEWQRVVQRVTTNDNEWQPVVQVTTSDNEWQQVVQRVTTSDNRWHRLTRSDNEWQFWLNFLFSNNMVLVWGTIVVFLKLSTSYLLFIIKMCFFFFDEKHVLFCITKRHSS